MPPFAPPRLPPRALLAALAVHALAALLLWPLVTRVSERREWVQVSLRGPEALESASGVEPVQPVGAAGAATGAAPPEPLHRSVANHAAREPTYPPAVLVRPPSSDRPASPGVDDALATWWSTRSAATFVEQCRAGESPADTVLARPKTPEQKALARTTAAFNDLATRLRGEWSLEKYREAYAENFPAMR